MGLTGNVNCYLWYKFVTKMTILLFNKLRLWSDLIWWCKMPRCHS